jgi:hypothetical protein
MFIYGRYTELLEPNRLQDHDWPGKRAVANTKQQPNPGSKHLQALYFQSFPLFVLTSECRTTMFLTGP